MNASIRFPRNGQKVDRGELVTGRIVPPGPVQILVKARDGKWYLQAPSEQRGSHWSVSVFFGDDDAPEGTEYEMAVVRGYNTIKESPLECLPEGLEVVTTGWVRRKSRRGNADGAASRTE
jgi:hypothetical protein